MTDNIKSADEAGASSASSSDARKGIFFAIVCYLFWGLLPLFWKLLDHVGSVEIVLHRMLWAFVFMIIIAVVLKLPVFKLLKNKRMLAFLVPASLIISVNWGMYIYAVNTDHVVEASLGYYINPLISILLGVVVLGEHLSRAQFISTILAAIGVIYLTIDYGSIPWIALGLATTFGLYGLIKKKSGYPAIESLTVETSVMFLPALFGITYLAIVGTGSFLAPPLDVSSLSTSGLFMLSGVITAVPLVLFAHAANLAPLSLIGFVQYFSPTVSLIIGIFVFDEPFTRAHAICFSFIWLGIAITAVEAIILGRIAQKSRRLK